MSVPFCRAPAKRVTATAVIAALTATFALVGPTLAAGCYGSNYGAVKADHLYMAKGNRSQIDHFTAIPIVVIAHPVQVGGYGTTDFLGVGTYKGGPIADNCSTDTTSNWYAYFDGIVGATYFCHGPVEIVGSTATNVRVTIFYSSSCQGLSRWAVYVDGTLEVCKTIGATSGQGKAGSESAGTSLQQTLTVRHHDLQYMSSTGTWNDWANPLSCRDLDYDFVTYSDTDFKVVQT